VANNKFKKGKANEMDDMVRPFNNPLKTPVKLQTGFSAAKSDALSDLQLMRFEKYEPEPLVGKQSEYYGIVLSIAKRQTTAGESNARMIPAIVTKVRIPVIHTHLPCPRSTEDRSIINMYPDFYVWDPESLGEKQPEIGSIVKVSFDNQNDMGKIFGNGTVKSVVFVNPPGLPGPDYWGNTFADNILDGSGDLIKKCADQRSLNDNAQEGGGQPLGPELPPDMKVSARNPRKLNSPHANLEVQTPITDAVSSELVAPESMERYIQLTKEYDRQKELARRLNQPVPYKSNELRELEMSNVKIAVIPVFGKGGLQTADAIKEGVVKGVQAVAGEESTLGVVTEAVLSTPEFLLQKTVDTIASANPFAEQRRHQANARKALERALAHQNKNRVGYGQNKASATPPNQGIDCSKVYAMSDFASKNLEQYRENIRQLGENEKTWDYPTTDRRIATLHPKLRAKTFDFIKACEAVGIFLRVTSGFRSYEEQNEIYAKGRTVPNNAGKLPGTVVSNARGGQSVHNFGLAFDVVEMWHKGSSMIHYKQPIRDRRGRPTGKVKSIKAQTGFDGKYPEERWQSIGRIAQSFGFFWGFHFSSPKDRPHFQDLMGQKVKQLDKMIKGRGAKMASMRFRESVNLPRPTRKNPKRSTKRMIIYPKV
jgi:hypothetical protein